MSWGAYRECSMLQVPNVPELFTHIKENKEITNVVEMGTCFGGLTNFLADIFPKLTIHTFDIINNVVSFYGHANINFILEDVHSQDTLTKYKDVLSLENGSSLLVIDGGDKALEFNYLKHFAKSGDILMVHDFSIDREDFDNRGKAIWDCFECGESDLDLNGMERSEFFEKGLNYAWGIYEKK
tara:strand:- start:417 stop:965 length:549 start_codon:yes stop_codon:yes gene_type:complete